MPCAHEPTSKHGCAAPRQGTCAISVFQVFLSRHANPACFMKVTPIQNKNDVLGFTPRFIPLFVILIIPKRGLIPNLQLAHNPTPCLRGCLLRPWLHRPTKAPCAEKTGRKPMPERGQERAEKCKVQPVHGYSNPSDRSWF